MSYAYKCDKCKKFLTDRLNSEVEITSATREDKFNLEVCSPCYLELLKLFGVEEKKVEEEKKEEPWDG